MRGKRAKALRKMVYGDQSIRQERKYAVRSINGGNTFINEPNGLRSRYLKMKKMWKQIQALPV